MKSKHSFWKQIGLHDWFLKKEADVHQQQTPTITPDSVFNYIVEKFRESIAQLSFANRIVFFHEYIVCFNINDYDQFMNNKNGLFGLIVQESVKEFYEILDEYRAQGKTVQPASNKWVFRFVSHPDYARGDKSFIGKLQPGGTPQRDENLRVTFIPRQTGVAETYDVSNEVLSGFNYYSDGYYEVPFRSDLVNAGPVQPSGTGALGRLETILPERQFAGKKVEYIIRHNEITVSGSDETSELPNLFKIPSDWVSSPHLKIRYDTSEARFYVASFGEKTILNEVQVPPGNPNQPHWVELPFNSRMVLNGIVGVNLYKA